MFFASQPYTSELVLGSRPRRGKRDWRSSVIAGAILLLAVGCSDDDVSSEPSTETVIATTTTTAAPATTSAAPIEVPLPTDVTETYSIPDFGYSIDHPSDWSAETIESVTQFSQIKEESSTDLRQGLTVSLDHRTVAFLQSIGLTSDDPTAQDLVEFNTSFGWTDVRDLTEVEIFGSPAITVRATLPGGRESVQYQGIHSDTGEAFLFGFEAPTGEILDQFLPTWDAMLESITATE